MIPKPRNPFCEACVRAKLNHRRSYRGAHNFCTPFWGHTATGDHITSTAMKDSMLGISGDRDAFTIKEEFSGLKHMYPSKTKSRDETSMHVRHFCGDRCIETLYSDNSGEIGKAFKGLSVAPKYS